ncbi:MAG: hypothetical protein NTZ98_23245 [Acidobacteria bacterium]|nr:hypothetical protein [Acidobacteriota bacterium]
MNESLLLRFESGGRQMNVSSFRADEGIVFDSGRDASPLNLAIGMQPVFPQLLVPVQQRHDWRRKEFELDVAIDAGGLRFSGFHGDPEGLPAGVYDITVQVESYEFRDAEQRIILGRNAQTVLTLQEEPDRRRVQLKALDPLVAAVINNAKSVVDGWPLNQWIASPAPRAARQACLLNILAKLSVPSDQAGLGEPLIDAIEYIYLADVDRVYATAKPELADRLERLVSAGLWAKEGHPAASIHQRLLDGLAASTGQHFTPISYRQGGRNCLQIVIALPPSGFADRMVYADIDIDLGNPLWDLEGLIIHTGELLDPAKTDHLVLHDKLNRGETKAFLRYDIVSEREARA